MKAPLVNIIMPTYNHEKYIAQAIESVLMQKCDFHYQLIISDDCSTDNTFEICKGFQMKYPEKILLLKNEVNLGLIANYKKVLDACTAKYIAILESDDYWTDPLKLQEQANFFEKNPDIGIVHSRSKVLYEDGSVKLTNLIKNQDYTIEQYVTQGASIVPLTSMFRFNLFKKHIDINWAVENKIWTFDGFLWLGLIPHTKIHFNNTITGVYRVLNTSVSNNQIFQKIEDVYWSSLEIKKYYIKKHKLNLTLKKASKRDLLFLINKAIETKQHKKAKKYGNRIFINDIISLKTYIYSRHPFFYFFFILDKNLKYMLSNIKQLIFLLFKK